MRFLVVLALVANVMFLAWAQGWLDGVTGLRAEWDREPERMGREIRPDAVVVTPLGIQVTSSVRDEGRCFESGPYTPAEASAAEVAVAGVAPPGSWTHQRRERAGQWVVYLGPFPDLQALERREEDVRRTKVPYEANRERGELGYGLVLGRFGSLSEASAAQSRLSQQFSALRSAKVVNLVQPATAHVLRIESASVSVLQRLQELKGTVKPFAACQT